MSFSVRDSKFDVLLVAGPRVELWPSAGVRALSSLCADSGLSVGWIGGETLQARGVIPLPGTGALVLAEDLQRRIHRIHARAIVRYSLPPMIPEPFPGCHLEGLIPLNTAKKLKAEGQIQWGPAIVILGTGNRALKFGSELLATGSPEVLCVESHAQWGAKRFEGWEVEKRRFEMAGGRIVEAKPVSLTAKAPMLWELRLQDKQGIRVLEVGRVVVAGPLREYPGVREYPPGSFLFEVVQSALATPDEDYDGWVFEEERSRWLAAKIIKALATADLGSRKEELESIYKRARSRLKRYLRHREEPFLPAYQGKWISSTDAREIINFSGTPKLEHKHRAVASVECFENISCNLCEKACPENAIHFTRVKGDKVPQLPILTEMDCTACGLCLTACPSATPILMQENESLSTSRLTLSWRGHEPWTVGEYATVLNRKGEPLGSGRVMNLLPGQLVELDVPTHLIWEVRGIKRTRGNSAVDKKFITSQSIQGQGSPKVEITLNGERRFVREKATLSAALFEAGFSRPEDVLYCKDGSCGLCELTVDGVKKLACQTQTHKGMAIKIENAKPTPELQKKYEGSLCPCLNISAQEVVDRLRQGKLQSPEAVLAATHVGEGRCHGQLCCEAFRSVLSDEGLDTTQWIDWRFPSSDWTITPGT
ncbi:MAG: 4Fe-4S dicluster domain-containing protein [Methylotenera sp.]|nr:4Fe-4S dicluster domain-containing protein [Oligoflexia bacterium]